MRALSFTSDLVRVATALISVAVVLALPSTRENLRDLWARLRPDPDLIPNVVLVYYPADLRDRVIAAIRELGLVFDERRMTVGADAGGDDAGRDDAGDLQEPRRDNLDQSGQVAAQALVVRPGEGREQRAVRQLQRSFEPLPTSDQSPPGRILVSRVPRIQLESTPPPGLPAPSTPISSDPGLDGTAVQQLENLWIALSQAGLDGDLNGQDAVNADDLVVVIDTGFDETSLGHLPNSDLIEPFKVRWPHQPPDTESTTYLHGTAVVAAIRAAAPDVKIQWLSWPVQSEHPDWFITVVREVAEKRRYRRVVLNLSWSYRSTKTPLFESTFAAELHNAWLAGVITVCATGNVDQPAARRTPLTPMAFPASDGKVVAVGAVDLKGKRMPTSRYGGKEDGPSPTFMVCCGTADADGRFILLTLKDSRSPQAKEQDHGGTSIAAALASGLISRWAELEAYQTHEDADQRWEQAKNQASLLQKLATPLADPPVPDDEYGFGLLRLPP